MELFLSSPFSKRNILIMDLHLKNFKQHSEYEEFIESDEFVLPNVSYCDDENVGKVTIVHYHPYSSQTLTFENLVTATTVDSGDVDGGVGCVLSLL